jgi:hypothetical protein
MEKIRVKIFLLAWEYLYILFMNNRTKNIYKMAVQYERLAKQANETDQANKQDVVKEIQPSNVIDAATSEEKN